MPATSVEAADVLRAHKLVQADDERRQDGSNCGFLALMNLHPDKLRSVTADQLRRHVSEFLENHPAKASEMFRADHLALYYPPTGEVPEFDLALGDMIQQRKTSRKHTKANPPAVDEAAEAQAQAQALDAEKKVVRLSLERVKNEYSSTDKWLDDVGIKILVERHDLQVLMVRNTKHDWTYFKPGQRTVGEVVRGRGRINELILALKGVLRNKDNNHWVACLPNTKKTNHKRRRGA